MFTLTRIVALVVVLAALAGGYYFYTTHQGTAGGAPAAAGGGMKMPPANVTVQTLAEQKVRLWSEFSGRMAAIDYAEIRPEVSGRITKVLFQDGQYVKAGDEIIEIDPRPYEAAVARAQAVIATAQAKIAYSKSDMARTQALVQQHALSQNDLDNSTNNQAQAQAELASGEAQLQQAEIDLDRAHVKAPISGRLSRADITLGNVVQSGSGAPLLTSIVSQAGIYADFEVDEQTYLATIRNAARGNAQESRIPVQLVAQGDESHVYNGFIQSFDNRIDSASGTIRARARFENQDGALVPGMFVTVRLAASEERDALLVPDRAIGFDQDKKFVYVVDDNNKVTYREVQLGKSVGGQRVVESGLNSGDRVVIDGTQFIHPNDIVAPKEADAANELTNNDEQMAKTNRP
jgi:multidrug efflux system membrane fusion protein